MNQINNFTSIEQVTDQYLNKSKQLNTSSNLTIDGKSFTDVLKDVSELKFSKHASVRLNERDINLSVEQNLRLEEGVMKASEKGIKDSLIMVDSLAFIVNVPSQTVVTALDQNEAEDKIFTNIDGAVIV